MFKALTVAAALAASTMTLAGCGDSSTSEPAVSKTQEQEIQQRNHEIERKNTVRNQIK